MSIYNFVGGKSNHAKVMEKRLMVSIFKTKKNCSDYDYRPERSVINNENVK